MANPTTGTFVATGPSASFAPTVGTRNTNTGQFNIFLSGTAVATVALERSSDNGTTWFGIFAAGIQLYTWTYTGTNISETAEEPEAGVRYRLNCTAYTSGTVTYRVSQ